MGWKVSSIDGAGMGPSKAEPGRLKSSPPKLKNTDTIISKKANPLHQK